MHVHTCICHHCENADGSLIMRRSMNQNSNRSHEETEDMTFDVSQSLVLWSAQANGYRSPRMKSLTKDEPEQASYAT